MFILESYKPHFLPLKFAGLEILYGISDIPPIFGEKPINHSLDIPPFFGGHDHHGHSEQRCGAGLCGGAFGASGWLGDWGFFIPEITMNLVT